MVRTGQAVAIVAWRWAAVLSGSRRGHRWPFFPAGTTPIRHAGIGPSPKRYQPRCGKAISVVMAAVRRTKRAERQITVFIMIQSLAVRISSARYSNYAVGSWHRGSARDVVIATINRLFFPAPAVAYSSRPVSTRQGGTGRFNNGALGIVLTGGAGRPGAAPSKRCRAYPRRAQ